MQKNSIQSIFSRLWTGIKISNKIIVNEKIFSDSIILGGTNFCEKCGIYFQTNKTLKNHIKEIHSEKPKKLKKIVILGGGFGGVSILRKLQSIFEENVDVNISLVSRDNFYLYTPMLPEVASGTIHPSDISIPIRTFCKRARFFQANVSNIDFKKQQVSFVNTVSGEKNSIDYDYLVLTLGSTTNYFDKNNIKKNSFALKSLEDAVAIRNQIINLLEQADQTTDIEEQKKILRIITVGAGFAGVEIIGELNHFIKESVRKYYKNIKEDAISLILISAKSRILPEMNEMLSKYATEYLEKEGITIINKEKVIDSGKNFVRLSNSREIQGSTVIWTAGTKSLDLFSKIDIDKNFSNKIATNRFLQVLEFPNVFATGDCADIYDPHTKKSCPSTAQHAIQQSSVVVENLEALLKNKPLKPFSYKTRGIMATIGNRKAIVSLYGHNLHGFVAWVIWRFYYLIQIPTFEKRIKVLIDWTLDSIFKRDITSLGNIKSKVILSNEDTEALNIHNVEEKLFKTI